MQYTIFGQNSRQGSYILLINLDRAIKVAFGKFRKSEPLELQPSHYLYVGSALGSAKGRFPLASRLLRHASRSDSKPPHAIRSALLELFMSWGYRAPASRGDKKLHWHIDFLLDREEAELAHVFIFPGAERIEARLAATLAAMPETTPVADRLGAQDAAAGTHLFRIDKLEPLLPCLEKAMPDLIRQG
ncbi:GIY-YIG nuclease family protein [Chlorobaculum tepidum]|nr:GIY-YIG nuclease family protein [Chlorobaculum tepidum]